MEDIVDASLPDRDSKLAYTYTFLYIHISQSAFHSNVFIVLEKKLTFNSWNWTPGKTCYRMGEVFQQILSQLGLECWLRRHRHPHHPLHIHPPLPFHALP